MTLACGYGRPVPSNRFLASRQDGALDATPALLVMYGATMCGGDGGRVLSKYTRRFKLSIISLLYFNNTALQWFLI